MNYYYYCSYKFKGILNSFYKKLKIKFCLIDFNSFYYIKITFFLDKISVFFFNKFMWQQKINKTM